MGGSNFWEFPYRLRKDYYFFMLIAGFPLIDAGLVVKLKRMTQLT